MQNNNKIYDDVSIEKYCKIGNWAYVHGYNSNNKHSSVVQIHPLKLVYNCYKRFKTFSYSFDYIYQASPTSQGFFYNTNFSPNNQKCNNGVSAIQKSIKKRLNYMLYCQGVSEQNKQIKNSEQIQIFYKMMQNFINQNKNTGKTILAYSFAVSEQSIIDLQAQKSIKQVRQVNSKYNQTLNFQGSVHRKIQTAYQVYQFLQSTHLKKLKILVNAYYIVYIQIVSSDQQSQAVLFVDAVKTNKQSQHWDNNILLVLNKCILGLINRMDKSGNSHTPFRDCKITKILRPFLWKNSKVDLLTFVDKNDEQLSYQNLNFSKNMSKLKILINNDNTNQRLLFNENKPEYPSRNKSRMHTIGNCQNTKPKSKLIQQLKQLDQREHQKLKSKFQKCKAVARRMFRLPKTKEKQGHVHPSIEQLQQQQLKHKQGQQKSLIEDINKISLKRIEKISSVETKTQKIRLMKDLFTRKMEYQRREIEKTLEHQKQVQKFYNNQIKQLDILLKKQPKQIMEAQYPDQLSKSSIVYKKKKNIKAKTQHNQSNINIQNQPHKKYDMFKKSRKSLNYENPELPVISKVTKRRQISLRNKVQRGRVDYQSYLSQNIRQYQSYGSSSKK